LCAATSMAGACAGALASAASNFSMAVRKSRCDSAATPSSINALSWSISACSCGATFTSMDVFSAMPCPLSTQGRQASRTLLRPSVSAKVECAALPCGRKPGDNRGMDNDFDTALLTIAGRSYASRLLTGTGKYKDFDETRRATEAAGAQIVTVAIRRVNLGDRKSDV